MSWLARLAMFLLLATLAFGQITANTVTVTASQAASTQPDTAVFSVTVQSGIDKNFSDILAALQGSGFGAANFVDLNSTSFSVTNTGLQLPASPPPQLGWRFQLTVPLSKAKDTTASLTALAQSLAQNSNGLSLTFVLSSTQASIQTANCSLTDLVANARKQAQQLTSAAGLVPGMIQSIATSVGPAASCLLTVRFLLGTQLMLLEPGSITVTASRSSAVQPDQVFITLNITSGLNIGLDDVTAGLQQAGIWGATLLGVSTIPVFISNITGPSSQSSLQWTFRLTAPLSNTKDTLATIVAAQQALAKASVGESLSFFVSGTQVSPQLAAAQTCPEADLVKDAQGRAQIVATAAGVSAGTILDLGGGTPPALQPAFISGNFASLSGLLQVGLVSSASLSFASNCSLTVTFRLQQ